MNVNLPRVSVLLPVYNGAPFLAAAIESVLKQSFTDFELLILNDGSTDDSVTIAQSYADSRVRYFEHPNMGLPATLNKGALHARGEFLFRQDQDDLSYPDRFAHQVDYLDAHPDVAVLGTWARIFVDGDPDAVYRYHRHPTGYAAIALCSIFDSAFVHSSVAIRRRAFESVTGYSCDPERQPPEDFELWSRMCRFASVANLPEVLVDYREVASSMSRVLRKDFIGRMLKISAENLEYWLKDSPYAVASHKLAGIYHLNGLLPTQPSDLLLIDGALTFVGKALSSCGDTTSSEYKKQRDRIRHQLIRNYWVGRSGNKMVKLGVKALFKGLRHLHD